MTQIATDGTRYEVLGTDGPTVVLIHGLGLNRHLWQPLRDALAARFRVVTYDLYGHGDSPAPPAKPSLAVFAAQLHGLLNDLKTPRAAIIGFSLGGMIARRFAMDYRASSWALGILHSAHQRDAAARDAVQARVVEARQHGPQATVDAALQRWFTDDFRAARPDVMDQVRGWVLANRREVYPDIYQVLVDGVDELIAPQPPINCPTLVITGDQDFGNSPAMTHAIAAEIAGARTLILPGLRHMALAEAPEIFARELLDFLAAVAPRN